MLNRSTIKILHQLFSVLFCILLFLIQTWKGLTYLKAHLPLPTTQVGLTKGITSAHRAHLTWKEKKTNPESWVILNYFAIYSFIFFSPFQPTVVHTSQLQKSNQTLKLIWNQLFDLCSSCPYTHPVFYLHIKYFNLGILLTVFSLT